MHSLPTWFRFGPLLTRLVARAAAPASAPTLLATLAAALAAPVAVAAPPAVNVSAMTTPTESHLARLSYGDRELRVDLGVGLWAWPLPMDYNGDGLMDLVVVCTDTPSNGVYFFENTGRADPVTQLPLFKPGVRRGRSAPSPQVSYVNGAPVVTTPAAVYPDFAHTGFAKPKKIVVPAVPAPGPGNTRAKQWRYVDYDGDGHLDLIVGVDYWGDYGAVSPTASLWDATGHWKSGRLHGYVYLLRNTGTDEAPVYAEPEQLRTADGAPIDTYGQPSPSFADFRGTGKLDLICGEFTDGFTFFENIGTRTAPRYAAGRPLTLDGALLHMDLCMITPTAVDFDGDGILDLVCGDEDGRVALLTGTGRVVDGVPQFRAPRYFRQLAENVKFGALAIPVSVDWDGDGLDDLIVGNSAGYIGFIKNLGGDPPRWAAPVRLTADGAVIREQAGPNGSVQGPAERKWGYTNPSVADWDGDGLPDLLVNGIWGRVLWYRNIGTRTAPRLAAAQPIEVAWPGATPKPEWVWWAPTGRELITQWRSTPLAIDLNHDGLTDLVTLDPEGYLAFYERRRTRAGALELLPPQRIFSLVDAYGAHVPLRLSEKTGGGSGRRTFCFTDWDGDGKLDLIVNSVNANFLRNVSTKPGEWLFQDLGPVDPARLAGHNTAPTAVNWSHRAVPDLLIGAEDGCFYLLRNPAAPASTKSPH